MPLVKKEGVWPSEPSPLLTGWRKMVPSLQGKNGICAGKWVETAGQATEAGRKQKKEKVNIGKSSATGGKDRMGVLGLSFF